MGSVHGGCFGDPELTGEGTWRKHVSGIKKRTPDLRGFFKFLVVPTGFEPATSALRGRRPEPLDDGTMWRIVVVYREWQGSSRTYFVKPRNTRTARCKKLAGVEGVEPSHTVPETAVLPLDDTPVR